MLKTIFSYQYLFQTGITALSASDKIYLFAAAALIAAALFMTFYKRKKNPVAKNLLSRIQNLGYTIGLLALLWTGLRYEIIRILSARIIIWAIYFIGLLWLASILKYRFGKYRMHIAEFNKQQAKSKYI